MEKYLAQFTEIMREADQAFEKTGGGTRHYVRDCLFPLMEQKGLFLTEQQTIPQGIGWVKASERLPQPYEAFFIRIEKTKSIASWNPHHEMFVDDAGDFHPADQVEWLDEGQPQGREEWISFDDRLPAEDGRYWCYVEEITDLGISHFQWNCSYNEKEKRFSDSTLTNGERITHWRPLPDPPKMKP